MNRWTVVALHDEDSEALVVAGVVAGWHGDESTSIYTSDNLYRLTSFIEAPTADAAEAKVIQEFETALAEMAAETDLV
ncbi:hypothetical protein [Kitasatospora sp. NBC_01302]|uniref:hypothetical protein n=1 Tax=Kitasatospora sp. NBC_01302 TaxID=2903575 RepID=UPI002E107BC0|nr:hypothetical protein OG294_24800 [Kitasatospora sp. NBC_01302]